jgi:hypothetical protein
MITGVLKISDISDNSDLSDRSDKSERSEVCCTQAPVRRRRLPLSICAILVRAALLDRADLCEVMRGRLQ